MKIRVGRKVVGEVVGETFVKKVDGSKHFLKIPPAIAFDLQSLREAFNFGARNVEVVDKETGCIYMTSIGNIYANGFDIDRGFGKQIALPMSEWKVMIPA